jgi:hypothetical protein
MVTAQFFLILLWHSMFPSICPAMAAPDRETTKRSGQAAKLELSQTQYPETIFHFG